MVAKLEENERKEAEGPSVFSKRFAATSDDWLPIRFCNRPLRRTGNYCKYERACALSSINISNLVERSTECRKMNRRRGSVT